MIIDFKGIDLMETYRTTEVPEYFSLIVNGDDVFHEFFLDVLPGFGRDYSKELAKSFEVCQGKKFEEIFIPYKSNICEFKNAYIVEKKTFERYEKLFKKHKKVWDELNTILKSYGFNAVYNIMLNIPKKRYTCDKVHNSDVWADYALKDINQFYHDILMDKIGDIIHTETRNSKNIDYDDLFFATKLAKAFNESTDELKLEYVYEDDLYTARIENLEDVLRNKTLEDVSYDCIVFSNENRLPLHLVLEPEDNIQGKIISLLLKEWEPLKELRNKVKKILNI